MPLLFMLGAKDRRVPLDDAKQYINALRCVYRRRRCRRRCCCACFH